jgi:hypothetical protein
MKIPGAKAGGGGLRGRANSGFSYGCQGRINGEGDGGPKSGRGLRPAPTTATTAATTTAGPKGGRGFLSAWADWRTGKACLYDGWVECERQHPRLEREGGKPPPLQMRVLNANGDCWTHSPAIPDLVRRATFLGWRTRLRAIGSTIPFLAGVSIP